MKKIRIFSIIIFAVSLLLYAFFQLKHARIDDRIAPRISMSSDTIEISVEDDEEKMLEGVTASDSNDGDVSDTLIIESMGQFLSPGRRNVTVAAFDSSSNVAKQTRQVIYTDYSSPKFTLTEPLMFPLNTTNILENMTASDVLDGDITGQIKVSTSSYIDVTVADNYDTIITVTNTAGDTVKLPCTVTIYDNSSMGGAPQFELSDYLIYTAAGNGVNPWSYVTGLSMNGIHYEKGQDGNLYSPDGSQMIEKSEISIKGEVDTNTPGTYEYSYKVTDNNNRTGRVRLIVVVQ
ncbi:MAG: DUF5011 domain-containing protein [Lachnospiraceae bacterium]|nr:DUF5011 domain-containing protein [Lachnospiraceae bacterium]